MDRFRLYQKLSFPATGLVFAEVAVVENVGRGAYHAEADAGVASVAERKLVTLHQYRFVGRAVVLLVHDLVDSRLRNDLTGSVDLAMVAAPLAGRSAAKFLPGQVGLVGAIGFEPMTSTV